MPVNRNYQRWVTERVRELAVANAATIEGAVAKMLDCGPGAGGVLVNRLLDGTVTAELSKDVPYGWVYEKRVQWS